ncbi:MAG: DUF2878 domain-containing protein [Pseudomonadales bacterium]|nr:DUF2878 domain-containing protein [Pseudomonadales bacterium]
MMIFTPGHFPNFPLLLNFLLFQFGWFACVLTPVTTSVAVTMTILIFHFLIMGNRKDLPLLLLCISTGFIFDSLLQIFGLMDFRGDTLFQPVWLTCLWVLFAITIPHSLAVFFQFGKWFCFASGFTSAPLSYLAGVKLDAASFAYNQTHTLIFIGIAWGLLMLLYRQAWLRYQPALLNAQ